MGPLDAVAVLLAVGGPAVVVLRDAAAYGRPPAPPPPPPPKPAPEPRRPAPAEPAVVPERVRQPDPVTRVLPAPPRAAEDDAAPTSILAGLASVEPDEPSSSLRRAGALMVLLALVLVAAAAVGAGLFRAVSALG